MSQDESVIVGDDMPKGGAEPDTQGQTDEDQPTSEAPKLYAGKFKSPEDMERSYSELERKLGEQGSRLGETEKEKSLLYRQLEQLQSREGQAPTEDKGPEEDFNAKLAEISRQVEEGDLSISEGLMQTAAVTAQIAKMETVKDLNARQRQQAVEASQKAFAEQNPDFFDMQRSGELDAIMNQLPGFHDHVSAYFAKKAMDAHASMEAAIAAAKQDAYSAGKTDMAKLAEGDRNTSKVLQSGGKTAKDIGRKPGPMSRAEMRQSGLAALQRARGG